MKYFCFIDGLLANSETEALNFCPKLLLIKPFSIYVCKCTKNNNNNDNNRLNSNIFEHQNASKI